MRIRTIGKWIGRIVILLLALLGLSMFVFYVGSFVYPFHGRTFDVVAWKSMEAAAPKSCIRSHMARDLQQHLPAGMSAEEVRNLIGSTANQEMGCDFYPLGLCSPFNGAEIALLAVCYDAQGKVTKTYPVWDHLEPLKPDATLLTFAEMGKVMMRIEQEYAPAYKKLTESQLMAVHKQLSAGQLARIKRPVHSHAYEQEMAELRAKLQIVDRLLLERWQMVDQTLYSKLPKDQLEPTLDTLRFRAAAAAKQALNPAQDLETQRLQNQIEIIESLLQIQVQKNEQLGLHQRDDLKEQLRYHQQRSRLIRNELREQALQPGK